MNLSKTHQLASGGINLGTPTGSMARLLAPTIMHSGGTDPAPAPTPPAPPAPTQPAPTPPANPPAPTPPAPNPDDLGLDQESYPKAVVEQMMRDRIERVRKGLPPQSEIDAGKAAVAKLAEIEREGMSEVQRLQAENADLIAERDRLKGQVTRTTATQQVIDLVSKPEHGALNPSTVATLLLNNPAVTIDDAGQVQGAETAVATLKASDPYLFGSDASGGGGRARDFGQGRRGEPGGKTKGTVAAGADLFAEMRGKKKDQ